MRTVSLCAIVLAAAAMAPRQAPQPVRPVTFTIADKQDGDCKDGEGWISSAKTTYRLCSSWAYVTAGVDDDPVLLEAGLKGSELTHPLGETPREAFARLGSLLAMRPGEVLPFYIAEESGTSTEKKSGVRGSVRTIGDGVFEHKDSRGGTHVEGASSDIPPSMNPDALFIRTAKGGILRLGQGPVPAAGMTDFMGTVTVDPDLPGYNTVFVFKFTNEELGKWESINKTNHGVVRNADGQSIDYTQNLSITQPVSVAEVAVTVDDAVYRPWKPEGNLDASDKPGNSLTVKAEAHQAGDPTKPRRMKFTFMLVDVSEQKGLCMNWPLEGGLTNADLRFRKEDFGGDDPLEFVDEKTVRSKDFVERASVTVHAYDFGAYGTLRVTAKDETGSDAKVKVRGQDTADLSIPRDDNGNRVADGWEEGYGLGRVTAAMDEDDKPSVGGGDYRGDGLTLYEEYRGFRVKGKHVRTDPRQMDLFICDDTIGQLAGPGIALFESATGIKTHTVEHDELVNRSGEYVINPNFSGDTHLVAQHGVIILRGDGDPEAVASTTHGRFGPPRFTKHVQVPYGRDYTSGDGQADVAHELCHAVGVPHHGDGGILAKFWTWKQEADGRWQLYERDVAKYDPKEKKITFGSAGVPILVSYEKDMRRFQHGDPAPDGSLYNSEDDGWLLHVGTKNGEFSGDQECLLRYADKQAYGEAASQIRYIPDKAKWKMRTRLCTNGAGTGVNAPDAVPPMPRYGDAAAGRGNCRDQIRVSDKYGSK